VLYLYYQTEQNTSFHTEGSLCYKNGEMMKTIIWRKSANRNV